MLRLILILCFALCASVTPLSSGELQVPIRIESFSRDISHQPLDRYQAGHVFSRNEQLDAVWVESTRSHEKSSIESPIELPNTFQVLIRDVAVAFDGRFAVCGFGMAHSTMKCNRILIGLGAQQ